MKTVIRKPVPIKALTESRWQLDFPERIDKMADSFEGIFSELSFDGTVKSL
jgi:hypothetical protein